MPPVWCGELNRQDAKVAKDWKDQSRGRRTSGKLGALGVLAVPCFRVLVRKVNFHPQAWDRPPLKTKNAARSRHSARRFFGCGPESPLGEQRFGKPALRGIPEWTPLGRAPASNGSFPEGEGGKNPCRLSPTDALRMPLIWVGRYYVIAEDFANSLPVATRLEMGSPRTLEGGTVPVSEGRGPSCLGGCATIPYAEQPVRFSPGQPLRDRGECWKEGDSANPGICGWRTPNGPKLAKGPWLQFISRASRFFCRERTAFFGVPLDASLAAFFRWRNPGRIRTCLVP
jgi:hypothetical protein